MPQDAPSEGVPGPGESLLVSLRGPDLLGDPLLNKGTGFSIAEREAFALSGLMPPGLSTLQEQKQRAYENYQLAQDDMQRYLSLEDLQNRNETLFYRLLVDHIDEMAPIVYTPTVGAVCEAYSHLYRRPHGLYVSAVHRGRIETVLRRAAVKDCRIIVLTDNEAILGLGDLGVGGMRIPVGKLTLYAAGAGIHPRSCLAIDLDVGTNNAELLNDPLYLGLRQERLTGEAYISLLDELVEALGNVFPQAIMQWEDFANDNAFRVLDRYRGSLPSFNDDIQGTGAVVVAGLTRALYQAGRPLKDERVVFLGAGASGGGCALAVRAALVAAGLSEGLARNQVLCLDSRGLILDDRPGLSGHKQLLAADAALTAGWTASRDRAFDLADVVREFRPMSLVGASGQPGAFTEELVRSMHESCPRPVILPLSNPTSHAEALPADLLRWTAGAALVATGSPHPPVQYNGQLYEIGQANNVLIFPGLGLGAIAVQAREIPDAAFLAAARALGAAGGLETRPGAPLFPPIGDLRQISRQVASAVAHALVDVGAAPPLDEAAIEARISALVWDPAYVPYEYDGS